MQPSAVQIQLLPVSAASAFPRDGPRIVLLTKRLQVRQDVVHVVIGVFSELLRVGQERIVDGDLHAVRRKSPVRPGRVNQRNRELVAIRQRARDAAREAYSNWGGGFGTAWRIAE